MVAADSHGRADRESIDESAFRSLATRTGGDVWHDAPARSLSRLRWSIVQEEMLPITRPVAPRSSRLDFPPVSTFGTNRMVGGGGSFREDRRVISSVGPTALDFESCYPRGIDRSIDPSNYGLTAIRGPRFVKTNGLAMYRRLIIACFGNY